MLDFEVVLKSAKYWKENWLKTFRLQNELAAEAHKMAVWYMAASLILVAVLIALASVASMVFVFCFRHHSGPVACDYCKSFHFSFNPWSKSFFAGCLWIISVFRWLRFKLECCCPFGRPSENSYHTVCIDNGDDYCSDECSSGCCDQDAQCLGAAPGWQQYWHGTPCATV